MNDNIRYKTKTIKSVQHAVKTRKHKQNYGMEVCRLLE